MEICRHKSNEYSLLDFRKITNDDEKETRKEIIFRLKEFQNTLEKLLSKVLGYLPRTARIDNTAYKISRSISVVSVEQFFRRKSQQNSHLSSHIVSLEYGPTELDRVNFVHNELRQLNKTIGAKISGLDSLEHSFQILSQSNEEVEDFCGTFFKCDPTISTGVSAKRDIKDPGRISITIIHQKTLFEDKILQEDVKDLCKHDRLCFYVICDRDIISTKLSEKLLVYLGAQERQILRITGDKTILYRECKDLLQRQIKELGQLIPPNASAQDTLKDLTGMLIPKVTSNVIEFEEQLKTLLAKYEKTGVVGHLLLDKSLTIYVLGECRNTQETLATMHEIQKTFSDKDVKFIEVNSSFIQPHSTVKPGDKLYISSDLQRYGTLGMYGHLQDDIESNGEKSKGEIAITGAHVMCKGDKAYISIDKKTSLELGQCIWPIGGAYETHIPDVAVILIDKAMTAYIGTKLDKDIQLYQNRISTLGGRKVFKYGGTTGETKGKIQIVDSFGYQDATDPFLVTHVDEKELFSDQGDSGAIVFTHIEGKLVALGVIFGGECCLREQDFPRNACLVISLKNALERFISHIKNKKIVLKKF